MKYPRLSFENDKRRKLSRQNIEEIKKLRLEGLSFRAIGTKFNVSKNTAQYHCDSSFADKRNKKRYQDLKLSYKDNPSLKIEKQRDWGRRFLARTKTDNEAKIFKGKATYAWKKKKYHINKEFRDKTRKQALELYYRKKCKAKKIKSL